MPRFRDDWSGFPASKPLPVEGGIATSKQRGPMAESWWSKRFVAVLESYGLGGRMQRGRRYARTGQVVAIEVGAGRITAAVQGSRPRPYEVVVAAGQPSGAQWATLESSFRARVGFAARLLAGEVPPDLETLFADVGASLFPRSWSEVRATCTCPDGANPCKHIAAVLYVFSDQLDADPWLLLAWRGRSREEILGPLRAGTARDELPPWWPLVPGRPDRSRTPPTPAPSSLHTPEDPPDRVLDRLGVLEPEPGIGGLEMIELLRPAYQALRTYSSISNPDLAGLDEEHRSTRT